VEREFQQGVVSRRQIFQFHYTEWPDFGIPSSTKTIRELICVMDLYKMKGAMAGLTGPIVTHCSAGVGRTGTFIAVHICIEKMKYHNSLDQINIPRTVLFLRQCRSGMVQTAEQYRFIYEVIRDVRADLRDRAQKMFGQNGTRSGVVLANSSGGVDLTAPSSVTSLPSPSPLGASLSSVDMMQTDTHRKSKRTNKPYLKRDRDIQLIDAALSLSRKPHCTTHVIDDMEEEEVPKEKDTFAIEKKRRLSFSTC